MGEERSTHGKDENIYKILVKNLEGRDLSEDLSVDGRIILEWILEKQGGRRLLDSTGSGQGPVIDSCEHGNGPSVSIKGWEFLD
jgi:hypothetical protein